MAFLFFGHWLGIREVPKARRLPANKAKCLPAGLCPNFIWSMACDNSAAP